MGVFRCRVRGVFLSAEVVLDAVRIITCKDFIFIDVSRSVGFEDAGR